MSERSSTAASREATPNLRFTSQAATAEDVLKSQTVGLVQLADYKKRRAEALESSRNTPASGESTPATGYVAGKIMNGDVKCSRSKCSLASPPPVKKKRKNVAKGKLSFGLDEEEEGDTNTSGVSTPRNATPTVASESSDIDSEGPTVKRKLGPNASISILPKVKTKNALLKEAQQREQLRKEFLVMKEVVKATEMVIPFVFYDGTNIPGGKCRVKKGDQIWLFLDKARKVGAEIGVGGDRSRREWARVSVDDLILVRNEIILPHHYDFYYFLVNKSVGYEGKRIFDFSAQPTAATPVMQTDEEIDPATYDPLARPKRTQQSVGLSEEDYEGYNDDPSVTKVVDRRWYERNKHIFPASVWEDFDSRKDYDKANRKDTEGNSFFFS